MRRKIQGKKKSSKKTNFSTHHLTGKKPEKNLKLVTHYSRTSNKSFNFLNSQATEQENPKIPYFFFQKPNEASQLFNNQHNETHNALKSQNHQMKNLKSIIIELNRTAHLKFWSVREFR